MQFVIEATDTTTKARSGLLTTDHGIIPTPIFMPVGTQGSIKAIHQKEIKEVLSAPIFLSNTYHLYFRPGEKVIRAAGGLHSFINWDGALLTDSGGYQVYSLSNRCKITEEGVLFKSHLDGSSHLITPERAMEIQRNIGADIIMAFDECTPNQCPHSYAEKSMERTHRWLDRCISYCREEKEYYGHKQELFPIVQGSIYKDLRLRSANEVASREAAGYAIGGVCHTTGHLYDVVGWVCEILPKNKPRYLMGVGTPQDLLESIALGVDMFDCVMPTRNARNGTLFTTQGQINIRNKKWRYEFSPIDSPLLTTSQTQYSYAYLHHLIRSKERLGGQIASLQNLKLYLWIVRKARLEIAKGTFGAWKDNIIPQLMRKL